MYEHIPSMPFDSADCHNLCICDSSAEAIAVMVGTVIASAVFGLGGWLIGYIAGKNSQIQSHPTSCDCDGEFVVTDDSSDEDGEITDDSEKCCTCDVPSSVTLSPANAEQSVVEKTPEKVHYGSLEQITNAMVNEMKEYPVNGSGMSSIQNAVSHVESYGSSKKELELEALIYDSSKINEIGLGFGGGGYVTNAALDTLKSGKFTDDIRERLIGAFSSKLAGLPVERAASIVGRYGYRLTCFANNKFLKEINNGYGDHSARTVIVTVNPISVTISTVDDVRNSSR